MTSTLQANHFFESHSFGASPFFGRPLSSRIYPTENSISGPVFGNNIWQSGSHADYGSTRNHVSGQARARQPNLSLVLPSIKSNAQTFGLPGERRSPITADVAGALQTEPSSAHSRSQNESAILTPTSLTSHSETSSQIGQHWPDAKPQLNSGFTGPIFAGRGNPWPSVREFQPSFASTPPRVTNGGIIDFPKKASAPLNAPQATDETAHHSLDSIWAENNKPRKLDRMYQLNDPKSAIARSAFLNGNDSKKSLANARLDNSVSTHQLASLVHGVRLDSQGSERQDYRHGPFKHNQGRPYNLSQSGNQGFRDAEQYQSDLRAQNAYGQRHNPALRNNNDYSHDGTDRPQYSTSAPLSNLYPNRCEHRDIVSYDAALISQPDSSSGRLPNFVDDYGSHDLQSYASQVYGNNLCGPASNGAADARHGFCAYDTALGAPYLFSDLPVDRQNEAHQIVRSPLLEEFRLNGKTKKYELRDIYDHIVEFSGDQLGSRFIQHKLEIANSDEKDRVFKEIASNSRQLMTDVFGNYVIQKMFEHGNQSQKRVLANHMKGHVYALSTQTYGCRVVQKALEHILTDQQASLIQELDGRVLAVVENQNGNHVIQKAVEQVPGEHIQFIVDAHIGHVHYLAKHPYGCRVIQRMLEHCEPRAKRQILDELHLDIGDLIQDPFGNYVVQHVIVKGEMQDRKPVIDKVQTRLMENAMHKFASNVVEKALDYAEEDQRYAILRKLTTRDEHGQSQIIKLLSHQYGNYVIQKCAAHLSGHALHSVVEEMEQYLMQLRRVSTGKQVLALEGSIRDARQRLISQHYENPLQRAPTQPRTAVARR